MGFLGSYRRGDVKVCMRGLGSASLVAEVIGDSRFIQEVAKIYRRRRVFCRIRRKK
jgi:hypothetical protein